MEINWGKMVDAASLLKINNSLKSLQFYIDFKQ